MINNQYNKIVLPFFFIFDLFITIFLIYVIPILLNINSSDFGIYISSIIIWPITSIYFKSYQVPRVESYLIALRPTFFNCITFLSIFSIISWAAFNYFNIILIISIFICHHFFSIGRFIFFHQYRLKGKNYKNAILLGNFSSSKTKSFYNDSLHYGYYFIENFTDSNKYLDNLNSINKNKIELIFLLQKNKKMTDSISKYCDENGIRLKLILPLSNNLAVRTGIEIIGGYPILDIRYEALLYLENRLLKRIVDLFMSTLSIIFVLTWLPIIVKIAQIISYPGPLFFIQDRVGRDGKIFRLYKFRTMYYTENTQIAEKGYSKKTIKDDERIPYFGLLLRRTNLDEYPQFLNVFFGSMSTVGPRPHMTGEDSILDKNISRYKVRRFIKPGITGWAAIKGYRGGTNDFGLMSSRTKLDIWYLENWSIWLDIKIMSTTVWQMLTFRIPKAY